MAASKPGRMIAPLAALLGAATIGWLGLIGFTWSDYEAEALPSVDALVHGHFARFASLAPPYGGSLLIRAPFALLPSLWSGGSLAVYRALAAPCLLAAAVLGLWVFARMRNAGSSGLARGLTLALFACNPVTLSVLEYGHPEEILCACLCVAAVLLAAHDRPFLAGLLLGLAIGCKYWPVIAVGPVLLVLPSRRGRCLGGAALGAMALLAPIALLAQHFVAVSSGAASTASTIFQPWQAFWFVGVHGPLVHGTFGEAKPGFRTAPAWVGPISHPLVVAVAFAAAIALWWRRRGRTLALGDALLLLTLTMLLRCLLDTFDNVYYTLPFLFALLTWESHAGRSFAAPRPAVLALCAAALCWVSFEWLPKIASPDVESAFFLAWTVPLTLAFALRLYTPPAVRARAPKLLRARSAPSATS